MPARFWDITIDSTHLPAARRLLRERISAEGTKVPSVVDGASAFPSRRSHRSVSMSSRPFHVG